LARRKRRWLRWVIAGAAVLVLAAVGGPFVYIHFIEGPAPAPLKLSTTGQTRKTGSTIPSASVDGTWSVGAGSIVGYRVQEVLVGQNNTAVGRSTKVTGKITISGGASTVVSSASFSVPLSTVRSDQSMRDVQFDGRIMDVVAYPDAMFVLTKAIHLGDLPPTGRIVTISVTGSLTMHGTSRQVTFPLEARDSGSVIQVNGSIPVLFADWSIPNPSFAGFVTTENHGEVEFLLDAYRVK